MRIRRITAIQLVLSLVITTALAFGCESSPPTSTPGSVTTPPASENPADISGRVTIAETVNAKYQSGSNAGETMEMTPLEGQIYWIVDISVKNKSYENAVTAAGWKIVVDSKVYDAQRPFMSIQSVYPMTVPVGETGETTIRFPVPNTLKVSDAKLSYQGQEPYSYGKLTGGDMVAMYDWDLKKALPEEAKPTQVKVFNNWKFQINKTKWDGSTLNINLTITNLGERRDFYYPHLAVIDSTKKVIFPWEPEIKSVDELRKKMGEAFFLGKGGYPFDKEYYPNESWTGDIKFVMSPYSGETKLGLYGTSTGIITEGGLFTPLFDVGSPQ